jgi:hypothetical protein
MVVPNFLLTLLAPRKSAKKDPFPSKLLNVDFLPSHTRKYPPKIDKIDMCQSEDLAFQNAILIYTSNIVMLENQSLTNTEPYTSCHPGSLSPKSCQVKELRLLEPHKSSIIARLPPEGRCPMLD